MQSEAEVIRVVDSIMAFVYTDSPYGLPAPFCLRLLPGEVIALGERLASCAKGGQGMWRTRELARVLGTADDVEERLEAGLLSSVLEFKKVAVDISTQNETPVLSAPCTLCLLSDPRHSRHAARYLVHAHGGSMGPCERTAATYAKYFPAAETEHWLHQWGFYERDRGGWDGISALAVQQEPFEYDNFKIIAPQVDYVFSIFADSVSITSMLNEATGAMQDAVRQCNESAHSTQMKLSFLQGECYGMRRQRTQQHGAELRSKGKKGKGKHSSTHASVRTSMQQHIDFAATALSPTEIASLDNVGSRSFHRAQNERTKQAEVLGEEKYERLKAAAQKAGKRRKGGSQLVAGEVERIAAGGGARFKSEFEEAAELAEKQAEDGSDEQAAAVMERLLVSQYWKDFANKTELWVEVCAVLPGVASELRAGLPEGRTEPQYKNAITTTTSAWVKDAKAGHAGTVNWQESAAHRTLQVQLGLRRADALELLREAVPTIG